LPHGILTEVIEVFKTTEIIGVNWGNWNKRLLANNLLEFGVNKNVPINIGS
jgi:hypothetical protein